MKDTIHTENYESDGILEKVFVKNGKVTFCFPNKKSEVEK